MLRPIQSEEHAITRAGARARRRWGPTDGGLPATGQTTCWDSFSDPIPCAGTGHDGDTHTGAALAYVDNGDGTITDVNTGLMWEKNSSNDGSVHDILNAYTWDQAFSVHVATLNSTSFAGHADWRLPNVKELASIVNYENSNPAVSPAFATTNCFSPSTCTVLTCSCTSVNQYWSSSTDFNFPNTSPAEVWIVDFSDGKVLGDFTTDQQNARAVRGGS